MRPDSDDRSQEMPRRTMLSGYPGTVEAIPPGVIEAGSYRVRFATSPEDLDQVLALRYRIFNLELGEGLDGSHLSGRDEDELDGRFHHLIISTRSGEVVGTYRMQTAEMAAAGGGWYCEQEFEMGELPEEVRGAAVEIGRACVAREHRNGRVLSLLWRGLARYLTWNRKHVLFGCCSLTSQDEALGVSVHEHLEATGAVHPRYRANPTAHCVCRSDPTLGLPTPYVPALFRAYLQLGAKVVGPPAIDRAFKTIDWLVILDARDLDPITTRILFR